MAETSTISWTDSTWGPIYGCARVSEGCENCYAEKVVAGLARKFKNNNPNAFAFYGDLTRETSTGPRWTGKVKLHEKNLWQPLRWKEPRRIFVNSLSDVFHDEVSGDTIERIFAVMALAHWHTFQLLTKRPKRMQEILSNPSFFERLELGARLLNANVDFEKHPRLGKNHPGISWPLKNVWLGTSVENQKAADERVPLLIQTPAAVRFLSCEPLLGPVDLSHLEIIKGTEDNDPSVYLNALTGHLRGPDEMWPKIDWVIVGGESGPGFRPMNQEWAIDLAQQCSRANVAFFFKQESALRSGQRPHLSFPDNKAHYWRQFPGDLSEPRLAWINP